MVINNTLLERIWRDFELCLPSNTFKEMINTNTTWKQLENMLTDFRNLRNKYIGYNLGNDVIYLTHNENKYIFGIFCKCFILWDYKSMQLDSFNIDDEDTVPTKEFIDWFDSTVTDYENGIVKCSDCGKKIKREEIAGTYFAGKYCKECWEREWKEKEAKETYD